MKVKMQKNQTKTTKNHKAKSDLEHEDSVEHEETEEDTEDLDQEVLEALNIKKKSKQKPVQIVDYIPELERDDEVADED